MCDKTIQESVISIVKKHKDRWKAALAELLQPLAPQASEPGEAPVEEDVFERAPARARPDAKKASGGSSGAQPPAAILAEQALASADAKLAAQLRVRLGKTRGETISERDTNYLIRKLKPVKSLGPKTVQLLFHLFESAKLEQPEKWSEIFTAVARNAHDLHEVLTPEKLATALHGYASRAAKYKKLDSEDVLKLLGLGSVHGIPSMVTRQALEDIRRIHPTTKQTSALFASKLSEIPLAPKKDWTIFIYMASENDLEGWAVNDINAMERHFGDIAKFANVVVLADGGAVKEKDEGTGPLPANNWAERTRLLLIESEASPADGGIVSKEIPIPPESDLGKMMVAGKGELNLGDGKTMRAAIDFIQGGIESDNFFMGKWSHGVAWKGVSEDASDLIRPYEMTPALTDTARPVDVIGHDACLMANNAWAKLLSDVGVSYLVGSQELLDASGFGYDNLFKGFAAVYEANGKITPKDFANSIVDNASATTISSVDLSKTEEVWKGLDALGAALLEAGGRSSEEIQNVVETLPRYGSYGVDASEEDKALGDEDLVDIVHMCQAFKADFPADSAIAIAATELQKRVEATTHFKNESSKSYPGIEHYSHGLTAYLPRTGDDFSKQYIGRGAVWKDSAPQWIEFLKQKSPKKRKSNAA